MSRIYPDRYPGYVIELDGELLENGNGVTVYGEDGDRACVDRAVSVLGLDRVSCITVRKVWIVTDDTPAVRRGEKVSDDDKNTTA